MKYITSRDRIKSGVIGYLWKCSYRIDGYKIQSLLDLDTETCSESDAAALIGNITWTILYCKGCDKAVDAGIGEIGDDANDDVICLSCLQKAISLFPAK